MATETYSVSYAAGCSSGWLELCLLSIIRSDLALLGAATQTEKHSNRAYRYITFVSNSLLVAGDYFGERALITGEPRAATIIAQTPVTLMALDREAFTSLLGPLREVLDHNMNIRILKSIKLFEKLNKAEMIKISESMLIESFPSSYQIVKQGEQGK
jgi:hypothetical protein